ncbi:probable serine/threonine-protein kinase At1g09600 [Gossypium hirsutum]|uniref:Probable serine/threonine-protein kinase At1g09600 n=1 Tax=Gossypium hirsutum TaxID=3635 RepID=A0ABM2ZDE8_GOSHI|nr:probable serine/threonine-protein kinase At1g09600 [Gossypium hirsutum]
MGCLCSKGAKDNNINEKHLNKRKNKAAVQLVAPSSTQQDILEGGNDGDKQSFVPKQLGDGDQPDAAGWPSWLASVAGDAVKGWQPRRSDSFEKLEKMHM